AAMVGAIAVTARPVPLVTARARAALPIRPGTETLALGAVAALPARSAGIIVSTRAAVTVAGGALPLPPRAIALVAARAVAHPILTRPVVPILTRPVVAAL